MSGISGGELLARCLAAEGVRFVFGIPCPEVDPLLAALDDLGMRFVPVRHEAATCHMAEGLYKSSGGVAAVLGNPGPGTANLLPGIITALHEGVPLVAISAQHNPRLVYPSPPSTFQGGDQLQAFAPSVKWNGPILSWGRIPEVARMAFREMTTGRPGPVHIEVPQTVLYETGDPSSVRVLPPERYRAEAPQPSEAQLERVAELLATAERPAVLAGSGVDRAGAGDVLVELIELLGCPALSTMAGRAVLPLDHPQYVHALGAGGDLVKREADLVLVVGSRLGNLDLPFDRYWGDPERQQIVQIDVDPRNVAVTRPVALGVVADARAALEGLVRRVEKRGARPDLARYREADRAWRAEQFGPVEAWSGDGLHPAQVMRAVGDAFGPDAVYVTDGGNTSLWAHWFLPSTRPRSYLGILELGMLGTGIPSALGAKLAHPDREVVCVTGDGAAGFNFMELQSAAREGLQLTVVVFAEGAWTMEEPNELMRYGRTFGTRMGEVRWDLVAQGLGCAGFAVESAGELAAVLGRARAAGGPAVVCARTDRAANASVPSDPFRRFAEVYQLA